MEDDNLNPMLKPIMYTCATVFVTIMLVFGGCTMHSNTFDAERLKGQAEIERSKTEASIARSNAQLEEIQAIERLVTSGVNPIAARCAVMGWTNSEKETCLLAGADVN
jgi:hypothetical protein